MSMLLGPGEIRLAVERVKSEPWWGHDEHQMARYEEVGRAAARKVVEEWRKTQCSNHDCLYVGDSPERCMACKAEWFMERLEQEVGL